MKDWVEEQGARVFCSVVVADGWLSCAGRALGDEVVVGMGEEPSFALVPMSAS